MLRFPEFRSQREGRLQLVKPNDPILHTKCQGFFTVTREDIEEMFALMQRYGGLGLAAPQMGINAQLFIAHWGEVFVNPVLLEGVFSYQAEEGCLSLPGVVKQCRRYQRITLLGGKTYEGQEAQVIQHEIDHLNGILITDR